MRKTAETTQAISRPNLEALADQMNSAGQQYAAGNHKPDLSRTKYNLETAQAMLQLYMEDMEREMNMLQLIDDCKAHHLRNRYFEVNYRQLQAVFDYINVAADELRDL